MSLRARLVLSHFLVAALLLTGTYLYLKGFHRSQQLSEGAKSFALAEARLRTLRRARNGGMADLPVELTAPRTSPRARAELAATGLSFVFLHNARPVLSSAPLAPEDATRWQIRLPAEPTVVTLSSGRYLARPLAEHPDFVLLYPLADLDRASRELLSAFWVAGVALLGLTMLLARIFARELARPLIHLRDQARAVAERLNLTAPSATVDEIGELAGSYGEFVRHLQTAVEHKLLAIDELENYKAELLRANANLHRRLFQVKVLLSLWSERDKALDVKDFLSRFLEALLPGLPFEYGCVIIRPLAEHGADTIFAQKRPSSAAPDENGETPDATTWADLTDLELRDFLFRESAACRNAAQVRITTTLGRLRKEGPPTPLTTLSFRLQQGGEPLGSVHFLTEQTSPLVPAALQEFLLSLSAQVSAQLQIQALSFASRLDPVTRLYNRGYLQDRLREEVVRASRKHEPFSLALLEIDQITALTEKHGTQATDDLLRAVASQLKASCRGSDAVCRYRDSVLAIVLADTPSAGAKIFAENVRRGIAERAQEIPGHSLRVTVSLGLAEFPTDGDRIESLLQQAEAALTAAQEAGRNSWRSAA